MPHPDFNQPVAYVSLEGEREFEIVLNARDAEAPWAIHFLDGRYAERVRWVAAPGQLPLIPADWKPVPGVTRRLVDATEDWAWEHAHVMSELLWLQPDTRRDHEVQDNLTAVLFQGLLREVERGGPSLEIIPIPTKEDPVPDNDKDRDRSAITGQFVSDEYAEANPDTTVSERVKTKQSAGPESGPVSENASESAPEEGK